MKILDRIANRFGYSPKPTSQRTYAAALQNRLTEDWSTVLSSADSEVWSSIRKLRARSRQLERDNPFIERYLKLLENNVLGADGVGLQMKIRDPDKYLGEKIVKGKYDSLANQTIEAAWDDWGGRETCCVDGKTSWKELQKLALRSAARDGACFIVKHRKPGVNKYGFALQMLESDYLREDYNSLVPGGNVVKMGVEMTPLGKPVAYHFYTRHPYEYGVTNDGAMRFVRIPAEQVIHVFKATRQGQTNGVPWTAPIMVRCNMLDGYQLAELTAARAAACKGGFFEKTLPNDYQGPLDSEGNATMEMQPGVIEDLPLGVKFVANDPTNPSGAYAAFVKASLREISSGLGVSYNSLANDLENVNYSSIRAGLLEERSEWMGLQNWLIAVMHEPIFEEWLATSLLSGALKMPNGSALPAAKLDKFHTPEWKPRRWAWVDPKKDLESKILAIENGLDSRRSAIAEQGGDIEDVFADINADNELADTYGLVFGEQLETTEEEDSEDEEDGVTKPNGKPDAKTDTKQKASKQEVMPATSDVQSQALNGAQLQSITQVLTDVSAGKLSPDSAVILIQIALPTANQESIASMIASASKFKPTQDVETAPLITSPKTKP